MKENQPSQGLNYLLLENTEYEVNERGMQPIFTSQKDISECLKRTDPCSNFTLQSLSTTISGILTGKRKISSNIHNGLKAAISLRLVGSPSTALDELDKLVQISNDFKSSNSNNNEKVLSFSLNSHKNENFSYSNFLKQYFQIVTSELNKSSKKIVIVESLGRFHSFAAKSKKDLFKRKYETYLSTLNVIIKQNRKDFIYRRYIQVPIESNREMPLKATIYEVLATIPSAYIKHFIELQNEGYSRIEIFIIPKIRNYSFLIADSTTLLTEYEFQNIQGALYPDLLILNKTKKHGDLADQLIQTHTLNLESIHSHSNEPNGMIALTPEIMLSAVPSQIDKLSSDLQKTLTRRQLKGLSLDELIENARSAQKIQDAIDDLRLKQSYLM